MRWACRCCSVACPRRRTTEMRTVKSRGPDTPTLVSRLRRRFQRRAGNGGQKARCTGENAKQPFHPSRGECRVFSAEPVVTAACFFSAGGPWVRPAPGIPCALSCRGRPAMQSPDAESAAGRHGRGGPLWRDPSGESVQISVDQDLWHSIRSTSSCTPWSSTSSP